MLLGGKDTVWKDFLKIFFIIITLIHDIRTKKNDKYILTYLTTLCSGYSTEMDISSSNALKVVCGIPFYSCEVLHPSLPMEQAAITSQKFLDQFKSWFRLWWLRPLSHTRLQTFSQSLKAAGKSQQKSVLLGSPAGVGFHRQLHQESQISAQLTRSYKSPEFPGWLVLFAFKIPKTELKSFS